MATNKMALFELAAREIAPVVFHGATNNGYDVGINGNSFNDIGEEFEHIKQQAAFRLLASITPGKIFLAKGIHGILNNEWCEHDNHLHEVTTDKMQQAADMATEILLLEKIGSAKRADDAMKTLFSRYNGILLDGRPDASIFAAEGREFLAGEYRVPFGAILVSHIPSAKAGEP